MEMKQGIPQFSFLNNIRLNEEPVNFITRKVICNQLDISVIQNPEHPVIHGEYDCKFSVYSDGSEYPENGCPICEKLEKEIEARKEEIRQLKENEKKCREANVEPEYFNKTLDDYIPTSESQEKAKLAVEKLLYGGDVKKIILLGGNGTGKTMLGSIAAKNLGGKIYSMYEISTMIRQSYTIRADKSELEIVNELASVPFLAIDEMGRTKGSAAELNWLSYVLDKRHVRGLPFMIMSNGHLRRDCTENGCEKCFENYMDLDVISRLRQNSIFINIKAKDYRNSLR